MPSTNPSDADNVAITLLSKNAKTHQEWISLAQSNIASSRLRLGSTNKILDLSTSQGSSNPQLEAASGKVFEIHASLQADTTEAISLDQCKQLRNSTQFQSLQTRENVEIIIQPFALLRAHRTPGLAVFDMDSTLIQQEVIDELARAVGRYEEVAAVTEAAMRGELDFSESLRARVGKLKGVDAGIWDKLKRDVITITPGARLLVKALKGLGWKTAVLSGGFTPLATWLAGELGLDYTFANHLALDGEGRTLSGELVEGSRVIDGEAKRELLLRLAGENGIERENVIAVGDGSNDLLMMGAAGLGIAFNAKPKVQAAAPARLNSESLLDVTYLLGYEKGEIAEAAGVRVADLA